MAELGGSRCEGFGWSEMEEDLGVEMATEDDVDEGARWQSLGKERSWDFAI